ncbi:polyamine oxidase [Amborella trichopoda]|nr:polyamine oxidase [Amborella trichopoda]|eukprot:XP_006856901.2 polyamine oxidase [Amborella trichopoda]
MEYAHRLSLSFCFLSFFIFSLFITQHHHAAANSPKVIIVGAGMSGIMAAKTLSRSGFDDYLILEGSDRIGGRMHKKNFAGTTIEIGANWVEGLGGPHMNPIWELAKNCSLRTFFTDHSNVSANFYDSDGTHIPQSVVSATFDLERAAANFSAALAATLRENNEEDLSIFAAQRMFGYVPQTPLEIAVDYLSYDAEIAEPPRITSLKNVEPISTMSYYGEDEQFVADERGYEYLVHRLAGEFMETNSGNVTDKRLHLEKVVREIQYGESGVTILVEDGSVYNADHAILSVSIGVLQSKLIRFKPELPRWKRLSIFKFDMAIFTKIFLKFPYKFWPTGPGTEAFAYASERRGYFTYWMNLENQYPGSNMLMAVVTDDESRRIERQADHLTKQEAMVVLRKIFGSKIPDAEEILIPRWGSDPLYRGTYTNWPIGVTEDDFDDLKAPVGPLYFTGEHTSKKFNGYVHGAYFSGIDTASLLLECLKYNLCLFDPKRRNLDRTFGRTRSLSSWQPYQ